MSFQRWIFHEQLGEFVKYANYAARELFDKLDPQLNPRVVLLAIPYGDGTDDIRIEPDGGIYRHEAFASIRDQIRQFDESWLTNFAFDVQGVLWQERVELRYTIQDVLDQDLAKSDSVAFATFPSFMRGCCVIIVLNLSKHVLFSHYAVPMEGSRGLNPESLIYEAISSFLYGSLPWLDKLALGHSYVFLEEKGEVALREAAHWLMRSIAKRSEGIAHDLLTVCNVISTLSYEGSKSRGRMIISRDNHPNVESIIRFDRLVGLENYRRIRKLLEIASAELSLLSDSIGIYGLGKPALEAYDEKRADLFIVEFTGHHQWRLIHAGHEVMIVHNGEARLPSAPLREAEFHTKVQEKFPGIAEKDLSGLWSLAREAVRQQHGSMLVITDHAKVEAQRLAGQSTVIAPLKLTSDLMLPLSSIDGAIMMTPPGICHAIGVILDGMASENGDPARGARYNSAVRYLEYARGKGHACLIIVISEDGMINIM